MDQNNRPHQFPFLNGGGEMGQLTRSFNWAKTVIGVPENWPQSLKTTLSILLNSKFPMFLFWGPELICFYNDAYRPSLGNNGKHPDLLGSRAADSWQEIWEFMSPQLYNILAGGEATWNENQLVPIYRNGKIEDVYWTFSYSPVADESGNPAGVFVTCNETTGSVLASEEMAAANEELASSNDERALVQDHLQRLVVELADSESRFRSLAYQSPVAIALFKTLDLVIDIVNERMLEIWGKTPDIHGKTLPVAMPELEDQPFIKILQDVITTGQPYYGNESKAYIVRNGELIEGYFNFICQPIKDESGAITSVLQVVTEITEQVTIRLELQKAEELTRFAVEAARLGAWHIHPVTKALVYNATLAKLFGYEGKEPMTYDQAIAQVTDEHRPLIVQAIDKAITKGGDYDITYMQSRFNDGKLIWLRSLGKVSKDLNGDYTLFSGFVMDVTEQKKDEQRKNDFIGMVSHELKTPLTSLKAYVQVLSNKAQKSGDSFTSGALEKANLQVKKMSNMINGFLDISRLESGKIHLNKQDFNIDELINEMIEEAKLTATGHSIELVPCEPIEVNADRDKIGSVISNLLSNAVKYSPKNTRIEVDCTIINNQVRVSFKDQGMGIKPRDIQHLFDRFYRVENPNYSHISGFGIGLYLSSEIINRHEGQIGVESTEGSGSTFYFILNIKG